MSDSTSATERKYSRSKTQDTPINSQGNYRREMKLVPINMDYCLLEFDKC